MIYIGIDPGKSGGIAIISDTDVIAFKMPETERDVWEIVNTAYREAKAAARSGTFLCSDERRSKNAFAFIEKVGAMPKQGLSSTFKFGRNYGFLRGCLIASGLPFWEVTPQKWQASIGCLTKGDKNVSKAKAQQLFPQLKITHYTADALLIAEYCRRFCLQTQEAVAP